MRFETLGERESGTARLEAAVNAYENALKPSGPGRRCRSHWAMVQGNLANLEIAFFEKTGDVARLDAAEAFVQAARDVFEDAGASQYLGMADAVSWRGSRRCGRRRGRPWPIVDWCA